MTTNPYKFDSVDYWEYEREQEEFLLTLIAWSIGESMSQKELIMLSEAVINVRDRRDYAEERLREKREEAPNE